MWAWLELGRSPAPSRARPHRLGGRQCFHHDRSSGELVSQGGDHEGPGRTCPGKAASRSPPEPKEPRAGSRRAACTPMFTAASLTAAKRWAHPSCPWRTSQCVSHMLSEASMTTGDPTGWPHRVAESVTCLGVSLQDSACPHCRPTLQASPSSSSLKKHQEHCSHLCLQKGQTWARRKIKAS